METKEKAARKQLTKLESFQLMQAIQENYTKSSLDDKQFAEDFTAKNFYVNENHVANSRQQLGITAKRFANVKAVEVAAEEVIRRLGNLEDKLDRLLKYFSEQARRDL